MGVHTRKRSPDAAVAGDTPQLAKGEVLIHEGDPDDSLHLVAKGLADRATTPLGIVATVLPPQVSRPCPNRVQRPTASTASMRDPQYRTIG